MAFQNLNAPAPEDLIRRVEPGGELWGFVHIPKTAGVSLIAALSKALGPIYNVRPRDYSKNSNEFQFILWEAVLEFISNYKLAGAGQRQRLFHGHIHRRYIDYIQQEISGVRLFTIVRHPVARAISEYKYCRTPAHPLHETFNSLYPTIFDYINSPNNKNIVSKYLYGPVDAPEGVIVDFILKRFEFVGIYEAIEPSLEIISGLLGCDPFRLSRLNVTDTISANFVEVTDAVREAILDANQLDLAIYERAKSMLPTRMISRTPISRRILREPPSGPEPSNAAGSISPALDPQPVFILGAPRSGTSAMLRLCRDSLGYSGGVEGSVWQSVKALDDHFARILHSLSDINPEGLAGFSVTRLSPDRLLAAYVEALLTLHEREYGTRTFVDKSPGAEAIGAAPTLKKHLAAAKFIFMKRRGIENVQSQLRRFPGRSFETACAIWARSMGGWLQVRDSLGPDCIEIEQRHLDQERGAVSVRISEFLGGSDPESIERFFAQTFPEKTTPGDYGEYISLRNSGWDEAQMQQFCDICGEMMSAYGYTMSGADGVAPGEQLDLAARPANAQWRVNSGNQWINTRGPGLALHPNDPGKPPPVLRMAAALRPGRYRFEGEVIVQDPRCKAQRLVMSASNGAEPVSWDIDVDGSRLGRLPWRVPEIEIRWLSDVSLEVLLGDACPNNSFSATNLVAAVFHRL